MKHQKVSPAECSHVLGVTLSALQAGPYTSLYKTGSLENGQQAYCTRINWGPHRLSPLIMPTHPINYLDTDIALVLTPLNGICRLQRAFV